jgi:hypothetical protein
MTIQIFSPGTKEKDKESIGCHHTLNLNTKSWSWSDIIINGPASNKGAKSSIARSMAVPYYLLLKSGFILVTTWIKETSDPVKIKHTQSSVERKIEMPYLWPPTHNPSDCL